MLVKLPLLTNMSNMLY